MDFFGDFFFGNLLHLKEQWVSKLKFGGIVAAEFESDDLIEKMSGSTHQHNYHNGIKLNLIIRVKSTQLLSVTAS